MISNSDFEKARFPYKTEYEIEKIMDGKKSESDRFKELERKYETFSRTL